MHIATWLAWQPAENTSFWVKLHPAKSSICAVHCLCYDWVYPVNVLTCSMDEVFLWNWGHKLAFCAPVSLHSLTSSKCFSRSSLPSSLSARSVQQYGPHSTEVALSMGVRMLKITEEARGWCTPCLHYFPLQIFKMTTEAENSSASLPGKFHNTTVVISWRNAKWRWESFGTQ